MDLQPSKVYGKIWDIFGKDNNKSRDLDKLLRELLALDMGNYETYVKLLDRRITALGDETALPRKMAISVVIGALRRDRLSTFLEEAVAMFGNQILADAELAQPELWLQDRSLEDRAGPLPSLEEDRTGYQPEQLQTRPSQARPAIPPILEAVSQPPPPQPKPQNRQQPETAGAPGESISRSVDGPLKMLSNLA